MDLSKEAKTLIKSNVVLKLVGIVTELQLSHLVSHKLEQFVIELRLFFSPFPTITRDGEHDNFRVAKLVSLHCKSWSFPPTLSISFATGECPMDSLLAGH